MLPSTTVCPHTGEPRSREAPPDPVAPPPPSAEAQGGLAGVRKTAKPISHASDGSPAAAATLHGPPAVATIGGVVEQVADLGSVGEGLAAAADNASNTAAVSTHAGPEADPYHLGGAGSSY